MTLPPPPPSQRPNPRPLEPSLVRWEGPPKPTKTQLDKVMEELDARPDEWGLIYEGGPFGTWWTPLRDDDRYELEVISGPAGVFGDKKVYARRIKGVDCA